MPDRSRNLTAKRGKDPANSGTVATYETIAEHIRKGIKGGSLPKGTVLLEGPIAALFGCSRSPVKRALASLEEERLLSSFDGRGFLVGRTTEPNRIRITPDMLQLEAAGAINTKALAWQPFYYDFEREIILRSVFGRARLNEFALARHLGVGRTVAHDLLIHAREVGIVHKDDRSRWWIVPLDEARFAYLYELRILLEPVALESAIGHIPEKKLDEIEERLKRAARDFPKVSVPDLDLLESDLHIDCNSYGQNPEILEALRRTRSILVAGKHIQLAFRRGANVDPFMEEHLEIIDAVRKQRPAVVRRKLIRHLELSAEKAAPRLAAFRSSHKMTELPYIDTREAAEKIA
jgi:DNA-binding GntR family transcriptional regulator